LNGGGSTVLSLSGLLPALWLGLAAGVLEVAIRACQHVVFGRLLFVGVDFWWASPLVAGVLVTLPTILLAAPFSRADTRLGLRVRYGLPLGLSSLGLLLLVPGPSRVALALVAAGIAVQGSRWLSGRSAGFERVVRRTLPILLLLPVLGGAGLHLSRAATGALGGSDTGGTERPNVLLIILDTVRAMELGLYGLKPTTSTYLDGFAAQGVTFDQAFSPAPWTAPSHASLFTGRRVHELSIDWNVRLDRTFPTLAEVLGGAGYATVGIVANTQYASAETGLARGFDHYEDYPLTLHEVVRWTALSRGMTSAWRRFRHLPLRDASDRIDATRINRRFLRWLDHRPDRPFFAFLNYFDAHDPYFPPEPFWSRFLPGEPRRPRVVVPGAWSFSAVAVGRRAYQGAIAYLDAEIAALFDSLRARGALRRTLVVVASDHGEEFFEHGLMGHGNSLYAPSVRVPLVVVWPGRVPAGVRVADPVSLTNLPATVLDLLGLAGPFPGPSLTGYWTGRPPTPVAAISGVSLARNLPDWYPVSHGALASARLGRYRYIRPPRDTIGELYDHETDPLETRNLAKQAWAAPILRELADTVRRSLPGKRGRPTH
jgi:arylsulfatase A-like enzyme